MILYFWQSRLGALTVAVVLVVLVSAVTHWFNRKGDKR